MPLSKDPDARSRQLANLRAGSGASVGNQQTVTHGAYSGRLIRQATGEHLASLAEQLPNASGEELRVQASRMAQIERLTAYIESRGLIRNQRQGTVYVAAELLAKLSTLFERQHGVLLERERTRPAHPTETLADVLAELTAENSDQDAVVTVVTTVPPSVTAVTKISPDDIKPGEGDEPAANLQSSPNLSASQRAAVAVREAAAELEPVLTAAELAAQAHVSVRTVERAQRVRAADIELFETLLAGQISATAAALEVGSR
jgi:hypothetical protein